MIDIISPLASNSWTQVDHHWHDDSTLGLWGNDQDNYYDQVATQLCSPSSPRFLADPSELLTFSFTSFCPDLSNCAVMGPHQQPYLFISTDLQRPTYTIFHDAQGGVIAYIEWQEQPMVQIRDMVSKCRVTDWLGHSLDKKSRIMFCGGSSYTWSPKNMSHDLFSLEESSEPKFLARISKGRTTMFLDITGETLNLGLLNATIVATFLLQCNTRV
ncbi:hypothetical protein K435DRAFT_648706 [Dendrothele bispora CBS 962.96]|uniref:DUF6593 domain-containing protein n=1 Tax=Dendrothele bispora (strain CBS 962.96) TaxID=1314807 RepID=A0A4S8MP17_DENBC|nr:hypothetical protein K435DRAFT_648706 [Dendrothele bispora CBS 962.96]